MIQKIITWGFYILFFLTPLFFTSLNSELFEYNKMMLVYLLTSIIVATWIIKMIQSKKLILNRTPLDIPLLLFLASQILSTIFSIDPHTSWWGYYSRSNGGLLSIISYILLFYSLVSNFTVEDIPKLLKAILAGGLLTALYAIPEHFGVSPSCVILTHQFTASCWIQDVQARVFATLGQPNWLGAYIAMLIFPSLYMFLIGKETKPSVLYFWKKKLVYFLTTLAFYLALTFTYSRGAFLGFLIGLGVFLSFWLVQNHPIFSRFWSPRSARPRSDITFKPLVSILIVFLLSNIVFGSALTRFKLLNIAPPTPQKTTQATVTQLESGGTESGEIRLIVWTGAWEIFKHYPLFGSGVETFAYSYYNFRPQKHNLVSEWDFLYNKAHNEYLNYLATTGILGFLSYSAIILTFIFWAIKRIKEKKLDSNCLILISSLLAGYIAYLVQNIFGFSVVMIALLFYIFPALVFVASGSVKKVEAPLFLNQFAKTALYKRSIYKNAFTLIIVLISIYFVTTLIRFWIADTLYKKGSDYGDLGNPGRAYNYLLGAVTLNSDEPLYRSELGFTAGGSAVALAKQDATTSADLKKTSVEQTEKALKISPKNVSLWRTAIRTYYELSLIDSSFDQKTLGVIDKTIALAPTDAKLYYNKALILSQLGKNDEAIQTLEKTLQLKPNYREAYFTLGVIYQEKKQKDKALEQFQNVLRLVPNDPDALKKIQELNTQ